MKNVWSMVCFYVKRELRNQSLAKQFLVAAIEFARENGAQYLEAYPVETGSPSYRSMGLIPMFEKTGFRFVKMAGSRRNVMSYKLN